MFVTLFLYNTNYIIFKLQYIMYHLPLFLDMLLHIMQQIQSVKNFQNKVCLVLKDGDYVTNCDQSFMGMSHVQYL